MIGIQGNEARRSEYEIRVDTWTRAFVTVIVDLTRKQIQRDGEVPFYLHVGKTGSVENFAPDMVKVSEAEATALIAARAAEVSADFVFLVSEYSTIRPDTLAEGVALRKKYGAVKNMPGSQRTVRFQLETRAGLFVGEAHRTRFLEGVECYSFRDVVFEYIPEAVGMFTNLLPS